MRQNSSMFLALGNRQDMPMTATSKLSAPSWGWGSLMVGLLPSRITALLESLGCPSLLLGTIRSPPVCSRRSSRRAAPRVCGPVFLSLPLSEVLDQRPGGGMFKHLGDGEVSA